MTTLTVTAKGQITLKQEILKRLGIQPGQKVSAEFLPNGNLEIAPLADAGPDIRKARGMLFRPDQRAVSLEEIQDAVEAGWAGEVS